MRIGPGWLRLTTGALTWMRRRMVMMMGYRHVLALVTSQPPIDLPPASFRVLLIMAANTLDRDTPPLYWGGADLILINLPPFNKPASGERAVRRHINVLREAGYVFDTGRTRGHRAIYQLWIPGTGRPVDNRYRWGG